MKYRNLEMKATYVGTKSAIFDTNGDTMSRHHRVEVTNVDNGKSIAFDYYPSISDPKVVTKEDYLSALLSLVLDASFISNTTDVDDFALEAGFDLKDTPVSKILETYNGCRDSYIKLNWLFDDDNSAIEELREALYEDGF